MDMTIPNQTHKCGKCEGDIVLFPCPFCGQAVETRYNSGVKLIREQRDEIKRLQGLVNDETARSTG